VCCVQLGHYGGMADELDSLKRDKNVLMLELVRLRQQQQVSRRGRGSHEIGRSHNTTSSWRLSMGQPVVAVTRQMFTCCGLR
jgi:hypothetical protein